MLVIKKRKVLSPKQVIDFTKPEVIPEANNTPTLNTTNEEPLSSPVKVMTENSEYLGDMTEKKD